MSIARHTSYTLFGALVPIAVSVITVPLYLTLIGIERYGLLAIYWTLLGFLGFLSLGMGPAVTQRLATMADATDAERSNLVWTAMALNLAMAVIGSVLILVLAQFYFTRLSATPAGLGAEVRSAIPWLGVALPVAFASGVLAGALQGRQAFGVLSLINSASAILVALVPLAAAYWIGPSLANLALATISVNLLVLMTLLLVAARVVPLRRPDRPKSALIRKLAAYGGWMSGTTLIAPAVMTFDRFLIGALLGPAAVSVYVIPYTLMSRIVLLPASLSSATLPRFASAEPAEVQGLQSASVTTLVAILTPLSVIAVAALAPFLRWWIGADLASAATPVGVILVAGFWVHGVGHVSSTVVMGRGRPDLLMKLLLAYLIPYLVLLYMLVSALGVVGAAIAWSLKSACDPLLFFFTKPDRESVARIFQNAAIVLAAMAAGLMLEWMSPAYWVVLPGLLALSFYLGWNVLSHWFRRGLAWTRA